jgi:hypothetical protein
MVLAPSSIPGIRWECISVPREEKSMTGPEGVLENRFLNKAEDV